MCKQLFADNRSVSAPNLSLLQGSHPVNRKSLPTLAFFQFNKFSHLLLLSDVILITGNFGIPMATISVRRLDNDVVQRLKKRASENKRSLESEVRYILEQVVNDSDQLKRESFRSLAARFATID